MSYSANTVSFGTTGNKNFMVGSTVQGYRVSLCGSPTGIESLDHRSVGVATGSLQNCQSTIDGQCQNFTSEVVHHWNKPAGVITDAVTASHVSFNAGTGFTINVTLTTATYQWLVEIWT